MKTRLEYFAFDINLRLVSNISRTVERGGSWGKFQGPWGLKVDPQKFSNEKHVILIDFIHGRRKHFKRGGTIFEGDPVSETASESLGWRRMSERLVNVIAFTHFM